MTAQRPVAHAVETCTLADLLERILDKGIVIAGDIKVNIVDIELLTIQIRLVICSVDKAREMGLDWWVNKAFTNSKAPQELPESFARIEERLARLEAVENTSYLPGRQ